MALCTNAVTVYGFLSNASSTRQATTVLQTNTDNPATCSGHVLLSPAEHAEWLASQANFGWDQPSFELAFGGALLLFVVGVGLGLIINTVRKVRTI